MGDAYQVLIIEDNRRHAELMADEVRGLPFPSRPIRCESGRTALQHIGSNRVDLALLDYGLPDCNGIDLLRKLKLAQADLPVVMVTSEESVKTAVEAMKLGASDYIVKDERYLMTLPVVVGEIIERRSPGHENPEGGCAPSKPETFLRVKSPTARKYQFESIITKSPAMEEVLRRIGKAVETTANVLLEGETGTGKELAARAIHFSGPRHEKRFVAQNCAAIPDTILERELFGHVRGAFSGADQNRRGLLDEADGGTLFLDEISETSLAFQATLLRVVQEREFRPVGSTETRRVNVRFIAATNQDLSEEVRQKRFRKDLY
ncbi:MAG: sigma-54-dependent transcriptional regulator, partial [Vicinamibacteria bacterium]